MSGLPKILLVTLEYLPTRGGVGNYYAGLVKHWPDEIAVPLDLSKSFWWLWPHWLPLIWKLNKQIKEQRIAMLWVGQALPIGYAAWWLKRQLKIPYVVFTHGLDILKPQQSIWRKWWLKKILVEADLVVANSEFTRNELLKLGIPKGLVRVIYPCVTLAAEAAIPPVSADVPVGSGEKIILSVGRLVARKGFDRVIGVMPRLLKRIPNLKYVIIGSGPEIDNLKLEIEELKLNNAVSILTDVNDIELAQWYRRSDVVALPCRQIGPDVEGFGLVFLEAASYGKPIVVGRSGGSPETVHHGYGGFVIDPESSDELYQALLRILSDADFAFRLGNYGREWTTKKFQWSREVEKLIQSLEKYDPAAN